MSIETVVSTMHESILILRFNKPNKKNAIDFDMCVHITNVLNDAAVNEKISMVVFTGTGDYYSSGFDVSYRNLPAGKLYIILEAYIKAFITFPKLIIALVNGPAIGIAATTLALCDFVFASDNAYFYTPFTKLGVVAEGCSSVTFPRLMGERKAMNMLLLNYKMPATEALECGLISNLYKHEDFIQKSWDQIKEITNLNQNSVLFTKKLINRNKIELLLRTNEIEMKALLKLHELRKELYLLLGADPVNGLTSDKAKELLEYYGPNILTPSSHFKWPILLFKSLCTGFSILIWVGAVLCFGAYLIELSAKPDPSHDNLYLGCVLIGIDVICGLFSFFQNYKSCKIMKTFNSLIPMHTNCLRDGVLRRDIPVHDLVKGDIVFVELGDVIPADIRIIDSKGFKVDNSSLTGESVAVPRRDTEGTANILESQNVAFFSALCVEGWARGVVICCGDLTALGRVAGLAARLQPAPSPLSREIQRFMRCMSAWALGLGVVVAAASFSLGYPFIQTTIFVIGIIVANIPEGLQPTVTASLTLTAKRMVAKKCLVKNLDAIEALGACTTICSDKTGTLTENKMCVRHIWMWNKKYFVVDPDFKSTLQHNQGFVPLKMCGALCSNATVSKTGDVRGDASEKAILNFLLGFDEPMALREQFPKVAEIPFNSVNKFQISVHLDTSCSKYYLAMKGAPECILNRCTTLTHENQNINMTNEIKEAAYKATEDLANTGERVLAFADLILDSNEYPINFEFNTEDINFPQENLRFLGLMGLIDPPREQVKSAIERVRAAGVRVMMVTGDHPATARAVALEVGIATNTCHVITGNELRHMTQDLLSLTLQKHYEIVFARTSPTQKLQIVEACQRQGNVVAVTGDGVNDAPALRRADIGISMGITGSQVSKQTADIILMDDNFATIVTGIEEGRKIFDNLKKSVCYILISNVPEILPVFMFILFSIPLPLGVMTILCVDLGTDMWPAVSLSHEQAEQDVMARPPRASERLVSPCMLILVYGHLGLIEFAAGMFAYFVVMSEHGFYPTDLFGIREKWDNAAISDVTDSLGQEWTYSERKELERICQAAYFVAVVITQMTNGIICKTRYNSFFEVGMKNKVLNVGLVFELGLAGLVCYAPGVNAFLRTYPLRLRWWFLALPFAALMFMFDEFRKHCIRNQKFNGWFNRLTYY